MAAKTRIIVVAPSRNLSREAAAAVLAVAAQRFGGSLDLEFHEQCFLSDGHFAGSDAARTDAFVEAANDASASAVWFARGGYGAGRLGPDLVGRLGAPARRKTYLGYSDAGFLLARLKAAGVGLVAHGPMANDVVRRDGAAAVERALGWLVDRDPDAIEPHRQPAAPRLAFNATVLAHALHATPTLDLSGRVLFLEEVGEHLYALDRAVGSILSSRSAGKLAGVRLGRVSDVPENDLPFGRTADEIVDYWCRRAGVPFLGPADIGHDAGNRIVPFD